MSETKRILEWFHRKLARVTGEASLVIVTERVAESDVERWMQELEAARDGVSRLLRRRKH